MSDSADASRGYLRVIIAGSRDLPKWVFDKAICHMPWNPTCVLSGGARGADSFGEEWAKSCGIEVRRFPADWETHGKSAGFKRNLEMAGSADALFAIWDGKSKGTKHMIDIAIKKGLKYHIYEYAVADL